METSFIAECVPPLHPAIGAERRRGNQFLLAIACPQRSRGEHGRHLVIEGEVIGGDLEGLLTPMVAADFLHGTKG